MRSNRSAVGWAKKAAGAPSSSAAAAYENGASASRARKLFVYVIGGITHRCALFSSHSVGSRATYEYRQILICPDSRADVGAISACMATYGLTRKQA